MLTQEFARAFAAEWVNAWNSHDLSRILSHYADDFQMTTPFIVSLMNEPTGRLKGKAAIGAYWAKALVRFPDLRFELLDALASVDSIAIYYRSVANKTAVEWLRFGADGKVVEAIAHYRD